MAGRHFTDAQIEAMAANPYTVKVTPGQISFTRAFKEMFYQRMTAGEAPADILSDCGYDPEVPNQPNRDSLLCGLADCCDGYDRPAGRFPRRSRLLSRPAYYNKSRLTAGPPDSHVLSVRPPTRISSTLLAADQVVS